MYRVGAFQISVLMALEELGGESCGTEIDRHLRKKLGEKFLLPQVQGALHRMERRGLITELRREKVEQLGRPRTIFAFAARGRQALAEETTASTKAASGVGVPMPGMA